MKKLAVIYDERFNLHKSAGEHPEKPARLHSIMNYLREKSFFEQVDLLSPTEADTEEIMAVHTREHLDRITKTIENDIRIIDEDTFVNKDSMLSARLAAGSVVMAVNLVSAGNYKYVYCPVRPPGHHAETNRAMGFCLFNNVAIGAKYALNKKGKKRIAIVDFDVHHGNGTQEIFYDSEEVMVINLHQFPLYPGTGRQNEKGRGKGSGYTINYPLPAGTDGMVYTSIIKEVIAGALEDYNPEMMFISSGFDAHKDDPLAQMELTEEDFAEITKMLKQFADDKNIPVISVLEGGYNLKALPASVYAHLQVLNS